MARPSEFLAWACEMFGPIAGDTKERASRFVEEAVELAHAVGLTQETIASIVQRVYSRTAGDPRREVGQAMATLELFALNEGYSPEEEAQREWERVQTIPREEWERRHAAKVALGIAS